MTLTYKLVGAGWAECSVSLGDNHITMTVSYLHDSLKDLASAVIALCGGADSATCTFMDEPGEHRLTFRRVDSVEAEVTVTWFKDWNPDATGKLCLQGRTELTKIPSEVLAAMRHVLETHGEEGYRHEWVEHDFPSDEYGRLETSCSNLT